METRKKEDAMTDILQEENGKIIILHYEIQQKSENRNYSEQQLPDNRLTGA
jgi:hypothetical protein